MNIMLNTCIRNFSETFSLQMQTFIIWEVNNQKKVHFYKFSIPGQDYIAQPYTYKSLTSKYFLLQKAFDAHPAIILP